MLNVPVPAHFTHNTANVITALLPAPPFLNSCNQHHVAFDTLVMLSMDRVTVSLLYNVKYIKCGSDKSND